MPHPRQPCLPSGNPCADIHSCPHAHWYRAKDLRPEKSDLGNHHPGVRNTKKRTIFKKLPCCAAVDASRMPTVTRRLHRAFYRQRPERVARASTAAQAACRASSFRAALWRGAPGADQGGMQRASEGIGRSGRADEHAVMWSRIRASGAALACLDSQGVCVRGFALFCTAAMSMRGEGQVAPPLVSFSYGPKA